MKRGASRVRTALVLGGGSDIARAIVKLLADRGLEQVVLAGRNPAAMVGPDGLDPRVRVHPILWDATDTDAHPALLRAAVEHLGEIDVVLGAVGLLGHHAGVSMRAPEVATMAHTNFVGPAAALATIAPELARVGHGTIVVLSSVAAVRPRKSNYVYGSAKAGLDAFSRGLADALHPTGARVLVVRAGFVRSRMTAGLAPAPFATDPETVAAAVVSALARDRSGVIWVPAVLRPLFAVLRTLPGSWWRRVAGDR